MAQPWFISSGYWTVCTLAGGMGEGCGGIQGQPCSYGCSSVTDTGASIAAGLILSLTLEHP